MKVVDRYLWLALVDHGAERKIDFDMWAVFSPLWSEQIDCYQATSAWRNFPSPIGWVEFKNWFILTGTHDV